MGQQSLPGGCLNITTHIWKSLYSHLKDSVLSRAIVALVPYNLMKRIAEQYIVVGYHFKITNRTENH